MPRKNGSAPKSPSVRQVKHAAGIEEPKNAIALLKADHREVEGLFKTFKSAKSDAEKQALAKKICAALKMHTRIEEEIFYPAFIKATGDNELHSEALVEHHGAKQLIKEIEGAAAGDPLFDARVKVLSEMIKHHVKEEERWTGMFAKARIARDGSARARDTARSAKTRACWKDRKAPREVIGQFTRRIHGRGRARSIESRKAARSTRALSDQAHSDVARRIRHVGGSRSRRAAAGTSRSGRTRGLRRRPGSTTPSASSRRRARGRDE